MTIKTPKQVVIDISADPGLSPVSKIDLLKIKANSNISTFNSNLTTFNNIIRDVTEVNIYRTTQGPGGTPGEIQINQNGVLTGDTGLTYEPTTDTLTTGSLILRNGTANLGPVGNIIISGGVANQILILDNGGHLTWGNNLPNIATNTGKYLFTNGITTNWTYVDYSQIANSPSFPGGNVANLATIADVGNAVTTLIGGAPGIIDTLGEIANALGNGGNFVTTVFDQLANLATNSNVANLEANIPSIVGLASNSYVDEQTAWANISDKPSFSTIATSGSYTDLSGAPILKTVATSGAYSDLEGLPTSITAFSISDGSDGQVLTTDGEGNFSFTASGAGISIEDFGEGFSLTASSKIVTNKFYSTNLTEPNQHYRLELDTNGVLHLADESIINGATLKSVANNYAGITAGPVGKDEDSWVYVDKDGAWIGTKYNTDQKLWHFDNDGGLTLPGGLMFSENYYIGGGEGSLAISSSSEPVAIITGPGISSKRWLFGTDGNLQFPDNTKQTTAHRNIPQPQFNIDGGSASAIFDIDMMFVDGGGSLRRGFTETYDGNSDGSASSWSYTNTLDGGEA
jgi:hypothetical protein